MLIDTNIIIEIAKKQEFYQDCLDLMKAIKNSQMKEKVFITQFALHAIEAMISRKSENFLREFLLLIHQDKINTFKTDIADDLMILSVMKLLGLDFDDATQYVCANKLGTCLVTFDKDFEGKGIEVKTPAQILEGVLK